MSIPTVQESAGNRSGSFDRMTKYVRVRSQPGERFVEFDFAIGDPELFVELVMPQAAFESFCRTHDVVAMSDAQMADVDAQMERWRYGTETLLSHSRPSRQ